MSVIALESDDPETALAALVLANDADAQAAAGDPLELGLLDHARSPEGRAQWMDRAEAGAARGYRVPREAS